MNVEIYAINYNKKSTSKLNKNIKNLAADLSKSKINLLYKTDINPRYDHFLENLADTFSSEDNVNTIIITNALDKDRDSSLHLILSNLTSNMKTLEQETFSNLESGFFKNSLALEESDEIYLNSFETDSNNAYSNVISIPDMGNGTNAYCFFYKGKKIITLPTEELSGVHSLDMIDKALLFAYNALEISSNDLSTKGYKYIPTDLTYLSKEKNKKLKKRSFWSNIIPRKGDGFKEWLRKIILILASLTFLITAAYLLDYLVIQPWLNDQANDKIKDIGKTEVVEVVTDPESGEVIETIVTRDWDALKEVNEDIIGWIKQDDTKYLDYPVLMSDNDNYNYQEYLYRDYEGNYTGYGSIFVDFRSDEGAESKNVIMHGHNMQDGRMFQALMNYGTYTGDLDYYKDHPTINFDTPDGEGLYKIISVYKTNTLDEHGQYFDYLTGSFNSDAEFMNYVYLIRERSLFDIPVDVNEDDQLITLSTCSYEYSEFRTVVVARKLRADESPKVETKKATINSDALWPDVYYGNNVNSKPKVTTFSTELEAGNIDWYDGKGNLKGTERMFTLYDEIDETGNRVTPDDIGEEGEKILPTKITLNKSDVTMSVGDTTKLTPSWAPDDTTVKTYTMSTTNKNVVRIANDGTVTALGPGNADIIFKTENGLTATCSFTVELPLTDISLDWATYYLKEGTSFGLNVYFTPTNTTEKDIIWSSSSSSVASVDSAGKVTAKKEGKTTITATGSNGIKATCTVNVYSDGSSTTPTQAPTEKPTEAPTTKPPTDPPTTLPPTDPPTAEETVTEAE